MEKTIKVNISLLHCNKNYKKCIKISVIFLLHSPFPNIHLLRNLSITNDYYGYNMIENSMNINERSLYYLFED